MTNTLENISGGQDKGAQDGLLSKLQPGKDRMTALLKVIAGLKSNPSKSFQDEEDILKMQQELNQITQSQKDIMDDYDGKYAVQQPREDGAWNSITMGGNARKDTGQSDEGGFRRTGTN